MPMIHTPKPRQFQYTPRFYDPEKEKWEALKEKYLSEHADDNTTPTADDSDEELRYFQNRVRTIDRQQRHQGLGWKDLFRKREMPKFNYTPRFQDNGADAAAGDTGENVATKYAAEPAYKVRIRRRYNMEDPEYMKPVSGTKIMIYVLLACLLLYWILF